MYIFRPPRLRLHQATSNKGYFLYLCWGKVTLKTSAVWKQSFFFFVNGMQGFFLTIKSQGITDAAISSLIKGQTEI